MGLLQRLTERASRRPFHAPEAWFYESAGSAAVADSLVPSFERWLPDEGSLLDLGCGGGVLAGRLARPTRSVVGADPSGPQVQRAARSGATVVRSGAERLPFASDSFDAVVSSCSFKHWTDRDAGVAECLRVVRPGGVVVLAEIDGSATSTELRAFAGITRIPRLLHPLYPLFARPALVLPSPTADELADALAAAGAVEVSTDHVPGLPFALAVGRRLAG